MCKDESMHAFYKIIYAGRTEDKTAAKILVEETDRMIAATAALFTALEKEGKLKFNNLKASALSYAMTVHGIIDYNEDKTAFSDERHSEFDALNDYIEWFCKENGANKAD